MSTSDSPIPDVDRLSTEEVVARVADLPASQVDALIAEEELHGRRMPVLEALYERREALGAGATEVPGTTEGPGGARDDALASRGESGGRAATEGSGTLAPSPQSAPETTPPRA
ncbi:hypothetical protein [Quadrisphaera sp. DSM 44207]|uniref:hypothetical protein n=1 Tax=Quadrisphaera sp. DSM 44207 TaxID=1881057 RepID=UPI00088F950A|nr:hypothetical protein [Quadrisphaera sp. DSM 44207]SDQ86230.1 hypothetical protein SAMN05428996_2934 [Quadrisphaera sp. DSM 44207]